MQTFVVAASLHQATGVLIDDDHLAVIGHHVIFVTLEQCLCSQCLIHMVNTAHMVWRVQIFYSQQFLDFLHALVGQGHTAALFVQNIVLWYQFTGNLGESIIIVRVLRCWRRDDQRRTRFVDQN